MRLRAVVYVLCFASGLAGLTYEVIWLRLLAGVLGNSSHATAAVLTAVMAGMGIGALAGGRLVDRCSDRPSANGASGWGPLRLYGIAELALGLFALAVPFLVRGAGPAAVPLLRAAGSGAAAVALRFVLAGAVVLGPACLLGATLPMLVRFAQLSKGGARIGPDTGAIYALNTLGAAVGCALTGYHLLGAAGILRTSALAGALDVAVGLVALALSRRVSGSGDAVRFHVSELRTGFRTSELRPGFRTALALAGVSGFTILGLEAWWTRLFRIVMGHDVHAFASMLVVVLVGLAIGAGAYRLLPDRIRSSRLFVPAAFWLLGTSAVLSVAAAGRAYLSRGLDVLDVGSSLAMTRSHEIALVLQLPFAAFCVLVPAIAAGAAFPALCEAGPAGGAGRRVGMILAVNTAGSISGSLIVPLALIPGLGIQHTLVALAGLAVLGACIALAVPRFADDAPARPARAAWLAVTVIGFLLAAAALPAGLPQKLLGRKIGERHLEFLWYEEGATATVAVAENVVNRERQLFVNGINEVTTRLVHDQAFELLGHLGLLLHPHPRRVLVVCLGAGISAAAVTTHDVSRVDVVDIERSVIAASRRFSPRGGRLLRDPRVEMIIDDGRNHLLVTDLEYDAIVVDSTHPRAVDSWILYTREFYEIARARLAPGGHLVQWLPLHGLSVDEFGIVVRTFLESFPSGSLWVNAGVERYGSAAYALLVGPRGRGGVDRNVLARRLADPRVRRDLAPWGLSGVAEILECFVAGPLALRRWTRRLPVNTDDLPYTQFLTRFSRAAPMTAERLLEVREPPWLHLRPAPGPDLAADLQRRYAAQGLLFAGLVERAADACGSGCAKPPLHAAEAIQGPGYFLALRDRYADDPERMLEIAAAQSELGEAQAAVETLEAAVGKARRDPRLWLNLGLARSRAGDVRRALHALRRSVAIGPDLAIARLELGLILIDQRQARRGLGHLRAAVELDPELAEAHAALGYGLLLAEGPWSPARMHLERALEIDPRNVRARLALGRLQLQAGRNPDAVQTFRTAARLHPYNGDVLFDLGLSLARSGRVDEASLAFERALEVNPDDRESRLALEQLRAAAR